MRQTPLILALLAISVLGFGSLARAQVSPFGPEATRVEGPVEAIPAVVEAYLRERQDWSRTSPNLMVCGEHRGILDARHLFATLIAEGVISAVDTSCSKANPGSPGLIGIRIAQDSASVYLLTSLAACSFLYERGDLRFLLDEWTLIAITQRPAATHGCMYITPRDR